MRGFSFSLLLIFCILGLCACGDGQESLVDLTGVKLERPVEILRFDRDFFAAPVDKSDSEFIAYLHKLEERYPFFCSDYVSNILGLGKNWSWTSVAPSLRSFLHSYHEVYHKVAKDFEDLTKIEAELTLAFRHLKYYYPSYPLPRVLTFVSPLDAVFSSSFGLTPDILTDSLVGISLLLHDASALVTKDGESLLTGVHESYIARRFVPETVVTSVMRNIVEDLYPDMSQGKTLLEQMLERGKRYYLLHRFLPTCPDSLLFYYTTPQLEGCYANEASIWAHIKSLDVLYKKDNHIIRTYLGEAPFTLSLSQNSPGNIGSWLGYRIVRSYMQRHAQSSLDSMMKLDPETLFFQAKYKPRNAKLR